MAPRRHWAVVRMHCKTIVTLHSHPAPAGCRNRWGSTAALRGKRRPCAPCCPAPPLQRIGRELNRRQKWVQEWQKPAMRSCRPAPLQRIGRELNRR